MAHNIFDLVWHKALAAWTSFKLRKHGLTAGSKAVVSVKVEEGGHAMCFLLEVCEAEWLGYFIFV